MKELWRYENCTMVNIIGVDGVSFCGYVLDCDDADDEEGWEETITVEAKDGAIRMFAASEIEDIVVVER